MSSTKFTPGPWRISILRPEIKVNEMAEFMPFGSCGCCDGVWINGNTAQERVANANLIAAAPELYEALLNMEVLFRRDGENSLDTFERIASQFQKDTGYMRPGKSAPMVESPQYDENLRRKKWDEWVDDKLVDARSALKKARGE